MPSTMDAAALAKMADRNQIAGGIVDGPLDLDIAVDAESARIKGVKSPVAGQADILIAPDIDAGNMIYKELSHERRSRRGHRHGGQGARDLD